MEALGVKKDLKVPSAVLHTYVGKYELNANLHLTISQEGERLFALPTGYPKEEIFPESENVFFSKNVDARIEFVKEADGKVTKLILHEGGKDMEGKKIQ